MKRLTQCRICKSCNLMPVLSLGEQYFTGIFPSLPASDMPSGELDLVWCEKCGLLQLGHSFSLNQMYGLNYGYRSGLNSSMVRHLQQKIAVLEKKFPLKSSDFVLDIGSNDATTLKAYKADCNKAGIDPAGEKFRNFYSDNIALIPEFFFSEFV